MAANKVKPGTAGIWIGILLILLGLGSCVGGPVWGGFGIFSAVDDAYKAGGDAVEVPATVNYTFSDGKAAGTIVGIADSQSLADSVSVKLTTEDGDSVDLDTSTTFIDTGEINGTAFSVIGRFEDAEPGKYVLEADGNAGAKVAILPVSLDVAQQRVLGGVGIGLLLALIGLILMIVTIVRRSKAKKQQAVGSYGSPPPSGMPPGPGGVTPPPPGMPPAPPVPGGTPPPPGQWDAGSAPAAPTPYPPAPEAYPPAPPAPEAYPPAAPPPPPQQPVAPPPPPQGAPPPPGQWGNDQPPQAPPFQ